MENLVSTSHFQNAFADRCVLVTGHTGFKGSWLTQWLLSLDAYVHGLALNPESEPSLFSQLELDAPVGHRIGDVRSREILDSVVTNLRPDFVFHLAAQPLVRRSYVEPAETFETNVQGTINLLESLRVLNKPCTVVIVTTDKCYKNRESPTGYVESDELGGYDPYSASKAMAELAVDSYRNSFFADSTIRVATARAGNVIGGGDWAEDRIVPDCMRSLGNQEPIVVRNKHATRPWQHVLDPLCGYLELARQIDAATQDDAAKLCSAFNFGPAEDASRTVGELVETVLKHWPGKWLDKAESNAPHETTLLRLSTEKAKRLLNWQGTWDFERAVAETVAWYRAVSEGQCPIELTQNQIKSFMQSER